MKYRQNRKTGDEISEIGIGTAYIYETEHDEAIRALKKAYASGINYYDLAAGGSAAFSLFGEAFHDVRENIFYQIHFGADYTSGDYGWTQSLEAIKKSVSWMLEKLKTNYIDYGFIHCQDEIGDWQAYRKNGVYDYILELKKKGIVRHIGLSSHTPHVIQKILDEADIDMLMFSVNPAYDYGEGEYAFGEVNERAEIYKRCEKEGIGISVMKPFSGGQLLDAKFSPFHEALTPYQCMRYALDKPGVLTILPGAKNTAEVESLLRYYNIPEEETDYAVISTFPIVHNDGTCVYCNHCKPCPMGIDVGLVNKYYDLAKAGDALAVEHYKTLAKNASDCIQCGHCDSRCPFSVHQSERMQEIDSRMKNHI